MVFQWFSGRPEALGTLWAPRDRNITFNFRPRLQKYCVFLGFIEIRGWLVRGKNDEKYWFFNGFRRKHEIIAAHPVEV